MCSVLIKIDRVFARVRAGLKALVHSAYVLCGVPERIILSSDKNKFIAIPDSVTAIGWEGFSKCDSLTDITIPCSVNYIDGWAFADCPSLAEIKVSADNKHYSSLNGVLFNKNMTSLMCYPEAKTDTGYDIPDSTAVIESAAFLNCSNITNITMPDSVTDIEYMAFDNCINLSQVNLSSGLTDLGSEIFAGCSSLKSIVIPDSITSFGDLTFDNCTALTDVTLPSDLCSIGVQTFRGCTSVKTITVPASVEEIGIKAFGYKDYSDLIDGFTLNCYSGTTG
ncbi:MAG: leucine-rich repeat domain-containing protein [Ruminiclostridium sp.]|nr:leucine-rich repeat domain-containing protein [Ruminiclostridium sp.]